MTRMSLGRISLAAVFLTLSGCVSAWKTANDGGTAGAIYEKAARITANGGLAAVGAGKAKTITDAVERAKTRAQTELTRITCASVDALRKDFSDEKGERKGTESGKLFDVTARQLKRAVLPEVPLTATEYETKDGLTTAYALMELNPKVLASALEEAGEMHKSLYALFSVSKAFKGLDERVKKYQEFRKQQGR